ncbi:MAG: DNA translocase FtsK 4TM domain-containing protein, partial [Candidatus Cryptobacteroides sp.]
MPKKEKKKEPKKASAAAVRRRKFRIDLSEENRTRIRKISGLVVCAFTLFTLISVVSYLFTWEADSSLLSVEGILPKGAKVDNWGGALGFRWSRFLVGRCFGLGAFALIFLLWAVFVRLFFKNRPVRLLRAVVLTLTGACLSSVIFSYISSMCCDDLFFGGGLGGDCGAEVSSLSVALMGPVVPGVLLGILLVVWLVFASGRFSRWFASLGDGYGRKDDAATEACGASDADSNDIEAVGNPDPAIRDDVEEYQDSCETGPQDSSDGESNVQDGQDDAPGFFEDDFLGLTEEDDEPDGPAAEDSDAGTSDAGVAVPVQEKDAALSADSGLEIIKGDGFSTDVKKELPRIDVRDELSKYVFPPL